MEREWRENEGTDISEITRKPSKTSKHRHENGRVYKSRKPKPEKVKSTGENGNSSGPLHDGRVRLVISKLSLSSLKQRATLDKGEHKRWKDFTLDPLTELTQMSLSRIATLAIRVKWNLIQRLPFTIQ
ncbi:hypothetical protein Tco_0440072 [Tanacetum coccineum]